MQGTSHANDFVLAARADDDGVVDAAGDAVDAFAGVLEIRGTSEGACLDPLVPPFEGCDGLPDATMIVVSADGLTIDVEDGPAIRLTGIPAIGGADEFAP